MSFSSDQPQITNQISQTINLDKENLHEQVQDLLRDFAESSNSKELGKYILEEKGTGGKWYAKEGTQERNVYRKTLDLVALNGDSIDGSESVEYDHNIDEIQGSAGIYAHCTSVDGLFFTAVWPDVRLTTTRVAFTNPHTEALSQVDVVANLLKEL